MPRRGRIMLSGVPVHVIQRGNNRSAEERALAYGSLVDSAGDAAQVEEIRAATNGGYALGDNRFRSAMARALGRRVEKGQPGRPARPADHDKGQRDLPL